MKKNRNGNKALLLVFPALFIYAIILMMPNFKTTEDIIRGIFLIVFIFSFPFVFWIFIYLSAKKDKMMEEGYTKNPIDDNTIKKYIPNFEKEKFLNDRYQDFLKYEEAYAKLDYTNLRDFLNDELYNRMVMDIDAKKIIGRKMFKSNFKYIRSDIVGINEVNGIINLEIEMIVSYKLCSDKKIFIKLFKNFIEHYSITFIMKKNSIDKCPSCGARLNDNSTQICEYCHNIIIRTGSKWVMIKIKSISKYLNMHFMK